MTCLVDHDLREPRICGPADDINKVGQKGSFKFNAGCTFGRITAAGNKDSSSHFVEDRHQTSTKVRSCSRLRREEKDKKKILWTSWESNPGPFAYR